VDAVVLRKALILCLQYFLDCPTVITKEDPAVLTWLRSHHTAGADALNLDVAKIKMQLTDEGASPAALPSVSQTRGRIRTETSANSITGAACRTWMPERSPKMTSCHSG